jgi:oxazoline/thiazoline dehydrogenase
MPRPLLLSLKPGVAPAEASGPAELQSPRGSVSLDSVSPSVQSALRSLADAPRGEDSLAEEVARVDGFASIAELYFCLGRLRELGVICYSVPSGEELLLTLEPVSQVFHLEISEPATEHRFLLSRFAYCRRAGSRLIVESPLSHARIILHGPAGSMLLGELACGRTWDEISVTIGADREAVRQALGLLVGAALIQESDAAGSTVEDQSTVLRQWEFHDLLFHARSRRGRHDSGSGATYRFLGAVPPLPAVKPPMAEEVIPLFRPELDRLMVDDVPLTRVLEERVSIREHGEQPISARQLGEFLYRTARVRALVEPGPDSPKPYAVSSRPYPGGGAAYELEVYVTVQACDGVAPGLYHYEPLEHGLTRLGGPNADTATMLRGAANSCGMNREPQILLAITARFQRISWKYETIAYAAVLKNVGVLYQTMYLVATAMGLAPCALGSGNSDLLARAAGLSYLEESSVGEFLLGRRRP